MLLDYLPILLQLVIAIGFAVIALSLSVILGKSGRSVGEKDSAYECGMLPVGAGSPRFSVKFYLVAMLFVIFDIEVVFMYPWAVQFKELIQHSAVPIISMGGFAAVLLFAYLYAFGKGALSWNK